MVETVSLATRRARAVSLGTTLIVGLVVASAAIRSAVAWRHSVPVLLPDEYIYSAIGRSIGHGHLQIRGETVHFPGLLEPILAAPIWRFFDIATAYHLVQVENAVAASLAAVPAYLLARSLNLGTAYALGTALYALVVPELVLIAYTSSDAVAFPLALTAIYLGVLALDTGSRRHQVGFLVFASLATLARVEYVALIAAYVVAATAIERRAVWRRHRVAFVTIVPVAVIFLIAFLGYYANEQSTRLDPAYIKWFFLQMFLLAVATGTVMVPGAVAALTRPRTRREVGLAVFSGALAALLLAEATAHAANSSQFKERYLFVLTPLVPIAFGLYIKHGRPRLWLVAGIAVAMLVAAARLPLSEYATASFKMDSQFLFAVSYVQSTLGAANASLVVALLTSLGAAAALALAFRGGAVIPLGYVVCFALAATVLATHEDLVQARDARQALSRNLTWIDELARGRVDAIETPMAPKAYLLYQLYWNRSLKRELLLGTANPTDAFSAPKLQIARDGTLMNASNEVLFHDFGTTGRPANAAVVVREGDFQLWRASRRIRLRLLVEDRFRDGWIGRTARLRAWTPAGNGVLARFRLSLPRNRRLPVRVRVGGSVIQVFPGQAVSVSCSSTGSPLDVQISASPSFLDLNLRRMSVRLDRISVKDLEQPPKSARRICASVG